MSLARRRAGRKPNQSKHGTYAAIALAAVAAGCGTDAPLQPVSPTIEQAAVVPGAYSVLSAVVTAVVRDADSAVVRFGIQGMALDSTTPAVVPQDSATLLVLGLLPATHYQLQVVAYGAGAPAHGDTLELTTGLLPSDLPSFTAAGTDPSPGFVAFAIGTYGVVIDNTGRVVWYRQLPGGMTLNFQPQATGTYFSQPVTPAAGDFTPWVEIDPSGTVLRTFGCAGGLRSRFHDIIAYADGSYWLMCDETRTMDLTASGGLASAEVTGTVIQHVSRTGALLFAWNAFDHFDITDLDLQSRLGPVVNWTHGNALDIDAQGHLLVSFRSLSEITSIDLASGAIVWRMGGLRNQFAFEGAWPPFTRQHGVRSLGRGEIQLLDNLGDQAGSRAQRLTFDETAHTVSRKTTYSGQPAVTALLGGSTQRLAGDRMLVAYGNGNRVQEYNAAGTVVWELLGNPGYIFRAVRVASLYAPGASPP